MGGTALDPQAVAADDEPYQREHTREPVAAQLGLERRDIPCAVASAPSSTAASMEGQRSGP
jgi:hypothetical protein